MGSASVTCPPTSQLLFSEKQALPPMPEAGKGHFLKVIRKVNAQAQIRDMAESQTTTASASPARTSSQHPRWSLAPSPCCGTFRSLVRKYIGTYSSPAFGMTLIVCNATACTWMRIWCAHPRSFEMRALDAKTLQAAPRSSGRLESRCPTARTAAGAAGEGREPERRPRGLTEMRATRVPARGAGGSPAHWCFPELLLDCG